MNRHDALTAALASVVEIRDAHHTVIGTGVAVAPTSVVTALHVVSDQPVPTLRLADGLPVTAVHSLPTRRFGLSYRQARTSRQRTQLLTGLPSPTVDLAMLAVPGLTNPAAPVRHRPVRPGERVAIAGYPNGQWTVSLGPITSTDHADYIAHVLLGPGSSGAPALDNNGHICGLVTMDHLTAGAILIGPRLLGAFLERTRACPWCMRRQVPDG